MPAPDIPVLAQAMRRTSRGDDPVHELEFVRSATAFVWAEQAIAGTLSRSWIAWTDARGGLRCPSRARFVELGADHGGQPVTVEPSPVGVALTTTSGKRFELMIDDLAGFDGPVRVLERDGFVVSRAPRIAEGRVEVWSRDPWLRVDYTGTNQRTTGVRFFGTREDLYPPDIPVEYYAESLDLLAQTWREQYDDFIRFTHVIVPMLPEPDLHRAFTVSSRQGAVFVDAIDPAEMVDNLIHENAHIKLRQLQLLIPSSSTSLTRRRDSPSRGGPTRVPFRASSRASGSSRMLQSTAGEESITASLRIDSCRW